MTLVGILDFTFNLNLGFSSKDIQVCETRVMRSGRGMPWDKKIALHPLGDGRFEMEKIEAFRDDNRRRLSSSS